MSFATTANQAPQGATTAQIADVLVNWLAHWLDTPALDNTRELTRLSKGGHISQDMFDGKTTVLAQHANHALTDLVSRLHGLGLDYSSEQGLTSLEVKARRNQRSIANLKVPPLMFNLVLELVADLRKYGPLPDFRPTQTCATTVRLIQALSRG